jgi:hypothetical protein
MRCFTSARKNDERGSRDSARIQTKAAAGAAHASADTGGNPGRVLTELAELAKPAADRFWRKYVPLQDVAKILRIGWQEMSGHRKRLDIPATRLTAPDGERNMMLTVEDARRLIADIVAVD